VASHRIAADSRPKLTTCLLSRDDIGEFGEMHTFRSCAVIVFSEIVDADY
jgi:hypothetical protein